MIVLNSVTREGAESLARVFYLKRNLDCDLSKRVQQQLPLGVVQLQTVERMAKKRGLVVGAAAFEAFRWNFHEPGSTIRCKRGATLRRVAYANKSRCRAKGCGHGMPVWLIELPKWLIGSPSLPDPRFSRSSRCARGREVYVGYGQFCGANLPSSLLTRKWAWLLRDSRPWRNHVDVGIDSLVRRDTGRGGSLG